MHTFKTQLDATAFLRDSGFNVSKSQFNRHVAARKVSKNSDGHFEESALLGYAAVHLDPAAQQENRALSDATVVRIEADADLKRYSAERQKLKLAKEQGLLMHRAEHEENLAARALFFKSEIESFGYRKAGEIIALVHGDDARLQELLTWWAEATADWMDAWAADHEFTTGDSDGDNNAGGNADAPQSPQEPDEAD